MIKYIYFLLFLTFKIYFTHFLVTASLFYFIISFHTLDAEENIVLIQPQRVQMKLRPGSSQSLKYTVGQSHQYPLDLYFLLDLSWSMNKTRNTVATKGS